MRKLLQFLFVLVLLSVGVGGAIVLTKMKPPLEKKIPEPAPPMVRAERITTGRRPIIIRGEGTVRPVRQIGLSAQVSGKVISISPALVDGGSFEKDDVLLQIDPKDYELAVTLAQAKVKESISRLRLAQEESAAAKDEWKLLHGGNKRPPALVAKQPQLAAAYAALQAAKADQERAELNLARTEIKAPFKGRVSGKSVDIGQQVGPGVMLGKIFSTEAAEIILPLQDRDLFWFHVPGFTPGTGPGAPAVIRAEVAGRNMAWTGKVVRAAGTVDTGTRLVNVVVRVEDPYGARPPLVAGLFVTVDIEGRTLDRVAVIPRSALRDGETIWVVNDSKLHFRPVKIARMDGENAIISDGVSDGDILITSPINGVTDGMDIRIASQKKEEKKSNKVTRPVNPDEKPASDTNESSGEDRP